MDFQLTDEQEMLRTMVCDFAKNDVEPTAAERDAEERFDREMFDNMANLGLTGIPWPEAYGGIGADVLSYCIAVEELSRVCASTGMTLSTHVALASWPIYQYGTDEQKRTFLHRLATGEALGAYAVSESVSSRDTAAITTVANKDGDDYILNGNQVWTMNGGAADLYIVFATTDPDAGDGSISAFIVEKGTKGFTFGKTEKKLGVRSSPTTELVFDHCRVPKDNLLGAEGQGLTIAMATQDSGRTSMAAQAVGIAQGALDAAVDYAKKREQFGKPIAANQAISFKLADMATDVEASRLLTYQASWLASEGQPYREASAMSKFVAGDAAIRITTDAVQVFGGYGYTKDYPVERYMRDATITQTFFSPSDEC
ncbi:acyl-CoA dehydrogenase AcdA [Lentibacillus halophilus]|uniref:Acyl-CoA dehydrogenase AcdA n=1 Tax=Lentibacillus halophilus TaxID=295065 RepID=A0ABN0Z6L7_9BACI